MHLLTPFLSAFAFAFAFASSSSIPIQPPPTQWARGYAFSSAEAHPHAGVQTRDGGFFVVGDGIEADPGGSTPLRSVMLLRTDKTGNPLWQKKIGTTGYNYGKFGIQLRSGHLVVAGALELMDDALGYPVLHRVLFLLDDATGTELSRAVLDNEGAELQLRDGFMCVVEGRKDGELVATGFVGGENSTTGYADEPMFLIGGGRAELSAFQVEPNKTLTPKGSMTIDTGGGGASPAFDARQGMRVLFDAPSDAYLVYSPRYGYAGALDALALSHDGKLMVCDWKTSNAVYDSHIMQVAAYAKAAEENLLAAGCPPDQAKVHRACVVRFEKGKPGYEVHEVENIDAAFAAFKAALYLFHYRSTLMKKT